MFIVLHCGGIPFNGGTIRERSLGGSESAAYYLAKNLAARGHKVSVFTNCEEEGEFDGVKYYFMGNTDTMPMGDRYHMYATNTPHDVNISQRHPLAFQHRLASKINILWLHDIGLSRNAHAINATMKNIDRVMTVSQFHKDQIVDSWNLLPEIITPITNGVDPSLYLENEQDLPDAFELGHLNLLYQSRPERGLANLVQPGGIMEQLLERRPRVKLYVCGYEHDVPHMEGFYKGLYDRVEELDNCVNIGHLPKDQLAALQQECDLLVYPTEFEEVSCITVMEAMHAGLPVVASKFAALPETLAGAGVKFIKHGKKGTSNINAFVKYLADFEIGGRENLKMVDRQYEAAKKFVWSNTATQVEQIICEILTKVQRNPVTMMKDMIRCSDIVAVRKYNESIQGDESFQTDPIFKTLLSEDRLYNFADSKEAYDEHYQKGTDAFYDGDFQVAGRENVGGTSRFESIASGIADLDAPELVIDYGCAHGHYTIELARRFPGTKFLGIDISKRAVQEATRWAEDEDIGNVEFRVGTAETIGRDDDSLEADVIVAAEVLEHVLDPHLLMNELHVLLRPGGKFIVTTPYGPWEQMSYQKDHPTRFHLHHFERADLHDLFSHHEGFGILACPSGGSPSGDVVGQYVTSFLPGNLSTDLTRPIDYERKFATMVPRQTVTLCMIAKDSETTIGKALLSIGDHVDEVIVGVDKNTTDDTVGAIKRFELSRNLWPIVRTMEIEPALESGFDEARNTVINEANGDWIMWFDCDEEVIQPQAVSSLLRNNQYKGYPLPQTHFSINPPEVLNTDFPVRLFRNHEGIRFFGVVHEHPEIKLNKGLGTAFIENAPIFSHNGYVTEQVRRERFDRNFPLMKRDREKYPERILGKFLWIRDVAHACQFFMQENNGQIIPEMLEVAREAIDRWEELLDTDQTRMIEDSMEYYGLLSGVLGSDLRFGVRMGASRLNGGVNLLTEKETNCNFYSVEHLKKFMKRIVHEKVKGYDTKHF